MSSLRHSAVGGSRGGVVLVAVFLIAAVVSGCGGEGNPSTVPVSSTGSQPTTTSPSATSSRSGQTDPLDGLAVAPESEVPGYERAQFGGGWSDSDQDGCDTRCEVLAIERRTDLPGLPDGGWYSVYDGYSTDDDSELDVDHVVALSEAWDSGAASWTAARREEFANAIGPELIAVTAATNRSKGDDDPAEWQPPVREDWCRFTTAWIAVKAEWGLTADPSEIAALRNMRRQCDAP